MGKVPSDFRLMCISRGPPGQGPLLRSSIMVTLQPFWKPLAPSLALRGAHLHGKRAASVVSTASQQSRLPTLSNLITSIHSLKGRPGDLDRPTHGALFEEAEDFLQHSLLCHLATSFLILPWKSIACHLACLSCCAAWYCVRDSSFRRR